MSWQEIVETYGGTLASRKKQAQRLGVSKEEFIQILQDKNEYIFSDQNQKETSQMKISRQPFSVRRYSYTEVPSSEVVTPSTAQTVENQETNVSIFKDLKVDTTPFASTVSDIGSRVGTQSTTFVGAGTAEETSSNFAETSKHEQIRQRIDEWMIENTGKITAVLKSNFLSVVVMLTLSIVVATVFTSRVALAVGVTPFFAYSIAILVDVSAIIFMFRGKKWLSWVFGLNIFLQIALTSESTLAKLWFSSDTILGLKVALLATAVLTAIEGFSSLSSQNKD